MQCRSNRFSLRNFPLGFSKKQAPSASSGFAPCRRWRPGVSAGLLGLWPKRSAYRSADALPPPSPRAAFRRPGGVGRLIGLWPKRSAYRSADAPPPPSPRAAVGGPGFRPAYWAFGPNARPTGARTRSLRLRHVPPFAGPGGSAGLLAFGPNARPTGARMRPLRLRPVLPFGGPGDRPAYRAFGPNARPTGARTRPLRLRPVLPFEPDQKKRTVDKIPLM